MLKGTVITTTVKCTVIVRNVNDHLATINSSVLNMWNDKNLSFFVYIYNEIYIYFIKKRAVINGIFIVYRKLLT